jgi:hypothetical protein
VTWLREGAVSGRANEWTDDGCRSGLCSTCPGIVEHAQLAWECSGLDRERASRRVASSGCAFDGHAHPGLTDLADTPHVGWDGRIRMTCMRQHDSAASACIQTNRWCDIDIAILIRPRTASWARMIWAPQLAGECI